MGVYFSKKEGSIHTQHEKIINKIRKHKSNIYKRNSATEGYFHLIPEDGILNIFYYLHPSNILNKINLLNWHWYLFIEDKNISLWKYYVQSYFESKNTSECWYCLFYIMYSQPYWLDPINENKRDEIIYSISNNNFTVKNSSLYTITMNTPLSRFTNKSVGEIRKGYKSFSYRFIFRIDLWGGVGIVISITTESFFKQNFTLW